MAKRGPLYLLIVRDSELDYLFPGVYLWVVESLNQDVDILPNLNDSCAAHQFISKEESSEENRTISRTNISAFKYCSHRKKEFHASQLKCENGGQRMKWLIDGVPLVSKKVSIATEEYFVAKQR